MRDGFISSTQSVFYVQRCSFLPPPLGDSPFQIPTISTIYIHSSSSRGKFYRGRRVREQRMFERFRRRVLEFREFYERANERSSVVYWWENYEIHCLCLTNNYDSKRIVVIKPAKGGQRREAGSALNSLWGFRNAPRHQRKKKTTKKEETTSTNSNKPINSQRQQRGNNTFHLRSATLTVTTGKQQHLEQQAKWTERKVWA